MARIRYTSSKNPSKNARKHALQDQAGGNARGVELHSRTKPSGARRKRGKQDDTHEQPSESDVAGPQSPRHSKHDSGDAATMAIPKRVATLREESRTGAFAVSSPPRASVGPRGDGSRSPPVEVASPQGTGSNVDPAASACKDHVISRVRSMSHLEVRDNTGIEKWENLKHTPVFQPFRSRKFGATSPRGTSMYAPISQRSCTA